MAAAAGRFLHHILKGLAELVDTLVDMFALGDKGRGDDGVVACPFDMQPVPEHRLLHLATTMARDTVGRDLDTGHHADAADVDDHRVILQAVDRIEEVVLEVGGVLEQPVFLIDLLCGDAGGTGGRVGR